MNYNKVIIAGNLTRDPELRHTPKGTATTRLSLALNRKYTTESGDAREEVTFVDADVWGRMAEAICKYARKGKALLIDGRLKLDTWDDKTTGQKKSRMGVVVEGFQFVGQRDPNAGPSEDRPAPAAPAPAPHRDTDTDDVPF